MLLITDVAYLPCLDIVIFSLYLFSFHVITPLNWRYTDFISWPYTENTSQWLGICNSHEIVHMCPLVTKRKGKRQVRKQDQFVSRISYQIGRDRTRWNEIIQIRSHERRGVLKGDNLSIQFSNSQYQQTVYDGSGQVLMPRKASAHGVMMKQCDIEQETGKQTF